MHMYLQPCDGYVRMSSSYLRAKRGHCARERLEYRKARCREQCRAQASGGEGWAGERENTAA